MDFGLFKKIVDEAKKLDVKKITENDSLKRNNGLTACLFNTVYELAINMPYFYDISEQEFFIAFGGIHSFFVS